MARGIKTGGRQKGTPNKDNALIRDMVCQALSQLGGVEYLARTAESHPAAFLSLIGKTMPIQVTGEGGGALQHSVKITFG